MNGTTTTANGTNDAAHDLVLTTATQYGEKSENTIADLLLDALSIGRWVQGDAHVAEGIDKIANDLSVYAAAEQTADPPLTAEVLASTLNDIIGRLHVLAEVSRRLDRKAGAR